MKNLYFTKIFSIFLVACSLESPSVAIDTEKEYHIISKNKQIVSPYDLRAIPLTDDINLRDFRFKFIVEGAKSYRIQAIGKKIKLLNIPLARQFVQPNKLVTLEPNDETFKKHRTFIRESQGDGYYRFLNKQGNSYRVLGIHDSMIFAFGERAYDQAYYDDNYLFKTIEYADKGKKEEKKQDSSFLTMTTSFSSPYLPQQNSTQQKKNICDCISNFGKSWGGWFLKKIIGWK
ncbi:MAG TPA: hypothetical protein VG935_02200 [Patescibacteria group bacterium]|nr:hypothetical protein [Patescibacteria group bacterium]